MPSKFMIITSFNPSLETIELKIKTHITSISNQTQMYYMYKLNMRENIEKTYIDIYFFGKPLFILWPKWL